MPETTKKNRQGIVAFYRSLNRSEWLTLAVIGLAQLCSMVTFSCIVPFFPTEAVHKGLNTTQIGLLIGVFQLVSFVASPILGKFMTELGPKRLFSSGLLIGGISAILFGLLRILPSGAPFFWGALVVRILKALGSACYATSSLTIIAQSFPGKLAGIMSLMEMFTGVGYTAGPLIGSALYEMGGFSAPFFTLGLFMLGASCIAMLLSVYQRRNENVTRKVKATAADKGGEDKSKQQEVAEKEQQQQQSWHILTIPELWLTLWAILTLEVSCFFYDASIADHLSDLNGGTMLVGLMISIVSAAYLVSAPLYGMLIDRWPRSCSWVMLFGSLLCALAIMLMGPSPFLPLTKSVPTVSMAFALLGFAISPLYIPTFQHCVNAAKDHGFNESSTAICGLISGLLQSAASLGAFLGATLGGAVVAQIGFGWTTALVAACHFAWCIAQLIFCLQKRLINRRQHPNNNKICVIPPITITATPPFATSSSSSSSSASSLASYQQQKQQNTTKTSVGLDNNDKQQLNAAAERF